MNEATKYSIRSKFRNFQLNFVETPKDTLRCIKLFILQGLWLMRECVQQGHYLDKIIWARRSADAMESVLNFSPCGVWD